VRNERERERERERLRERERERGVRDNMRRGGEREDEEIIRMMTLKIFEVLRGRGRKLDL
jgi:hypothetical protein